MLDRGQTIKNTNKIRSILYNIIEYFVAEDLMENNPLNNVKGWLIIHQLKKCYFGHMMSLRNL